MALGGIGVPLFLRMPVWGDITLYDLAARTILRGGIHYRDLFDTNTPGYVWLLTVIRSVVGWSSEALRAVDLLIVGGVVLVLLRLARRGGTSALNRWWLLAGCVGFYLFTEEQVHAQRDVWLALPALLAVERRLKRITDSRPAVFRPALLEGVLWAAAVWIKPHFLLVAAAVWLLTIRRLAGESNRPWRTTFADLFGNLLAGSLVGAAGVGYMVASGTWPHFLDVMTNWNVGYMEGTFGTLGWRLQHCVGWHPPWGLLLPPTAALAVCGLIGARPWAGRFRDDSDRQRYTRGMVGAVYLVWAAQSLVLQRPFAYVHVVEILISLAVWATHRWNVAAAVFAWLAVVQLVWVVSPGPWVRAMRDDSIPGRMTRKLFTRHPAGDPNRLRVWPDCFRTGLPDAEYWARQDALRYETWHAACFTWAELHQTAEFLREQQVKDRELVCWDDSPHPLYLLLGVEPGLRFMHLHSVLGLNDKVLLDELKANTATRFVVIDLQRCWFLLDPDEWAKYAELGPSPDDHLPPIATARDRPTRWPFTTNLTVFRSGDGRGRYVVFAVK